MTLAKLILWLLNVSIMLSVFAIGLKATLSDATFLFRRPALLLRALLAMNVLTPAFALIVSLAFELNPAIKIALVALSVCPTPPILPNKALKAGGRERYTIGLLVAMAALSIVLIPVTLELFEVISGIQLRMKAADVASVVATSIVIPLVLGIAVRAVWQSFADRVANPIGLVAKLVLVIVFLPILFTSARGVLALIGDGTFLALAAFAICALIVGHLLGGPHPEDRTVLALATSARHPAIALAIANANFPEEKLAGALVLIYMVLSGILAAPYLNWTKRADATPATEEKHVEA